MSEIEVSEPATSNRERTVVKVGKRRIKLRFVLEIPDEHWPYLLSLLEDVANLQTGDVEDTPDGKALSVKQAGKLMPHVTRFLRAVAPTEEDADRLAKLPLPARMRILTTYLSEQPMGEAFPSAD